MNTKLNTALLLQAISASRDGIAIIDARHEDLPVVFANDAIYALLGAAPESLDGQSWPFFSVTPDCEPELSALTKTIRRSGDAAVPLRLQLMSGKTAVVECVLKPVLDAKGKLSHYVVLVNRVGDVGAATRQQVAAEVAPTAGFTHRVDSLTGLKTWQHFRELFGRDWGMAQRDGRQVAVLLFDIDCFDHYNRRFGEQAGNLCLKRVARVLEDALRRAGDLVARYGGEEFITSVLGLDEKRTLAFGELLCGLVADLKIEHPECPVAPWVTVSAGIACVQPTHELLPEHLITAADQALSEAKASGRNRVVCAQVTLG